MKRYLILLLPLLALLLIGCAPDAAPFANSVDAAVAAAESFDAGADPAPTTVPANTDTDAGAPAGDVGITNTDPVTDCVGVEPQPQAETLASKYDVPYDDIMGWFCAGYGFGEIEQAYALAAETEDYSAEDLFAMREDGMGWGQIKQTLGVLADEDDGGGDDPPDGDACTGADPQPHAEDLATQFGVPYDEIMGWFCNGYGFGEIEQAYSLAAETDYTVEEIFAMREDGMGWGQIKQALDALPGNGSDSPGPPDNPGNGNGNGPPENPGNGNGPPNDPGPPDNPGNGHGNGPPENPGNGNGNGPPENPGNGNGNGHGNGNH